MDDSSVLWGNMDMYDFNRKDYWDIRKNGNDYVVIFRKEKLPEKYGWWDFPSHYNFEGKRVIMNNVCSSLGRLSIKLGSGDGIRYLYNESKGTFWDCKEKGFVFVAY